MQRRGFLKIALVIGLGLAASAGLHVSDSTAAPLSPAPLAAQQNVHRAVTSRAEAGQLAPQQVRWGHHHRHWHHRHWGWRHHHHHHRGWGHRWHHHHGHRHHW
jgi:hypothetical protein